MAKCTCGEEMTDPQGFDYIGRYTHSRGVRRTDRENHIISTVFYPHYYVHDGAQDFGKYETMVFRRDTNAIVEHVVASNEEVALSEHSDFIEEYK